jgi:indole-3-acetate monooxygenase
MKATSDPGPRDHTEEIEIRDLNENIVLNGIQELLPMLRSRREDIERARQLPDDVATALRRTGIFSLAVPRAVGGRESNPIDIMHVIEAVATADGSVGWCAMVGIANNSVAGYMDEAGAKEVFDRPDCPSAGIAAPSGTATRVEGGLRVSGRWSFASGIAQCNWVWAGCMVMENGKPCMTPHGPEVVHACLPVSEIRIHDTWHVSGLRGTGSNDFTVSDSFVPQRRIFALLDPAGHRKEPLYQVPPLSLFVSQVACVSLGIARSALNELTALAETKVPTMYAQPLAERAMAQVELARAEVALGGARAFLYETIEDMWHTVREGRAPSKRQLALIRAATTNAAQTAALVTQTANTLGGGEAIYASSSLQRHARDAEAITHHFTVAPHTWEQAGRVLLGRDPVAFAF